MVSDGKLDRHCVNALRENQEELKEIVARFPEQDPKDQGITTERILPITCIDKIEPLR